MRPTILSSLGEMILILLAILVIVIILFCIESAIAAKTMELKQRYRANKAMKKAYKELEETLSNALLAGELFGNDDSKEI